MFWKPTAEILKYDSSFLETAIFIVSNGAKTLTKKIPVDKEISSICLCQPGKKNPTT
jgi:hypothetical protein